MEVRSESYLLNIISPLSLILSTLLFFIFGSLVIWVMNNGTIKIKPVDIKVVAPDSYLINQYQSESRESI